MHFDGQTCVAPCSHAACCCDGTTCDVFGESYGYCLATAAGEAICALDMVAACSSCETDMDCSPGYVCHGFTGGLCDSGSTACVDVRGTCPIGLLPDTTTTTQCPCAVDADCGDDFVCCDELCFPGNCCETDDCLEISFCARLDVNGETVNICTCNSQTCAPPLCLPSGVQCEVDNACCTGCCFDNGDISFCAGASLCTGSTTTTTPDPGTTSTTVPPCTSDDDCGDCERCNLEAGGMCEWTCNNCQVCIQDGCRDGCVERECWYCDPADGGVCRPAPDESHCGSGFGEICCSGVCVVAESCPNPTTTTTVDPSTSTTTTAGPECIGDSDCDDGNPCTINSCDVGVCLSASSTGGEPCDSCSGADCQCDASGSCRSCEKLDGACAVSGDCCGDLYCHGGECVECLHDDHCPEGLRCWALTNRCCRCGWDGPCTGDYVGRPCCINDTDTCRTDAGNCPVDPIISGCGGIPSCTVDGDCKACEVCNGDNVCVPKCDSATQTCCPGEPDYCVPAGSTCCASGSDCTGLPGTCDGNRLFGWRCNGTPGYCVPNEFPQICFSPDPCLAAVCEPGVGCTFRPVTCDAVDECPPPACIFGIGCPAVSSCDATGQTCCEGGCVDFGTVDHCSECGDSCDDGDPCTVDACDNGSCIHSPGPAGVSCETCGGGECVCDSAGACVACSGRGGACSVSTQCCGDDYCHEGQCVECLHDGHCPLGRRCWDLTNQCCRSGCDGTGQCTLQDEIDQVMCCTIHMDYACIEDNYCWYDDCVGTPPCTDTSCPTCEVCGDEGVCIPRCEASTEDCCPGDPDSCVPKGETCCSTDDDCRECDGLTWRRRTCDPELGYCTDVIQEQVCDSAGPCQDAVCDPQTGCSSPPTDCEPVDTCTPAVCDPETGTCPAVSICDATGQTCCNGQCVNLGTTQNCGGCGRACPAGEQCCPGEPGYCIPAGSICCATDDDCSFCAGLTFVDGRCEDGACRTSLPAETVVDCGADNACIDSVCDPITGCSSAPFDEGHGCEACSADLCKCDGDGSCVPLCLPRGALCTEADDECCEEAGACRNVKPGEFRCGCSLPGDVCFANTQCCDEGVCAEGICTESCVPLSGACDHSKDCCDRRQCRTVREEPFAGRCGCAQAGDVCDDDDSCCGGGRCVFGVCTEACIRPGGVCEDFEDCCHVFASRRCINVGDAPRGRCDCVRLGDSCRGDSQTCGSAQYCIQGIVQRCQDVGGPCGNHQHCCGDTRCQNSTCVECRRPGESCTVNFDCCGLGACVNGTCTASCVAEGGVCDEPLDCCDDNLCVQVITGQFRCRCSGPGDVCDANSDCCGDGVCVGGRCTETCVPEGSVCDANDDCCTGAGNCNSVSSINSERRCRCSMVGDVCSNNSHCCGDLVCSDLVCADRCELNNCDAECQSCDAFTNFTCVNLGNGTPCSIGICNAGRCIRTCPNGNSDCVADGSLANVCCRDIGLGVPICLPGGPLSEGCLCNGNEDCGLHSPGLPLNCCATRGGNPGTCINNQSNCSFPIGCDPDTCEGVCCDNVCRAGECCEDADCAALGFDAGCAVCNPNSRLCEVANDGGDCDRVACGICDEGMCIDRCPAEGLWCDADDTCRVACNGPFGCGECGACNEATGMCESAVCPSSCEECVQGANPNLIQFVCRNRCADNPDGLTDCCEDVAEGFVCTNLNTDDRYCGECGVACTGCQYCDAGVCLEDHTFCADAPVCNVGTCEVNGACLNLPSEAGVACDTVPCGQCDGEGSCIDRCVADGLFCEAETGACVECLDAGDCESCETCESGVCVAQCETGEQCCPGDPDICIPAGRTCCTSDADCSDLNVCAGLLLVEWRCDAALGYCASVEIENCDGGDPCTDYGCDANTGCSVGASSCDGVPCGVCNPGTGTCSESCSAQGMVCGPGEECEACGALDQLCIRFSGTGNQGSCCDGLRCYDTDGGPTVCGPPCTPPGQTCPNGGRCCEDTRDASFCADAPPGGEVDCPL